MINKLVDSTRLCIVKEIQFNNFYRRSLKYADILSLRLSPRINNKTFLAY